MPRLRPKPHVRRGRSVVKTITWRVLASFDTFVLAFMITGRLTSGAFIAAAEVLTKIVLYYLHERARAHIAWGLRR